MSGYQPAMSLRLWQWDGWQELISDSSYYGDKDHPYCSLWYSRKPFSAFKNRPSYDYQVRKFVGYWPHEPNVNEEPKGVFQSRAYLIMYGLLVTAGLFLFSQTGRARIARLHC